jgi:hypothetical protein
MAATIFTLMNPIIQQTDDFVVLWACIVVSIVFIIGFWDILSQLREERKRRSR